MVLDGPMPESPRHAAGASRQEGLSKSYLILREIGRGPIKTGVISYQISSIRIQRVLDPSWAVFQKARASGDSFSTFRQASPTVRGCGGDKGR